MPDAPTPNKVTTDTASGTEEAYLFASKDVNMNEYLVVYSKHSETDSKKIFTVKLFNQVWDGLLLAQHGKLRSEAAITLGAYSGREIVVERPDGIIMIARFYPVESRFYHLSVETKTNERESEAIRRFLDSFKLLPMKQK